MIYISHQEFQIVPIIKADQTEEKIEKIRKLCLKGLNINCPPEDRALAWLSLLCIYPSNSPYWPFVCQSITKKYQNIITYYLSGKESIFQMNSTAVHTDQLLNNIRNDIENSFHQLLYLVNRDGSNLHSDEEVKLFEMHVFRIQRILYLFSKVNADIGYLEGLIEIVIPLYYVMYSSSSIFFNNIDYVEAVIYQALEFLLISTDLIDFFNNDASHMKMKKFDHLLYKNYPKFYKKLNSLNVHTKQYACKWFRFMFAQEHPIPQILPLWDSIIARLSNLSFYMFCIAISRIKIVKDQIEYDCTKAKSRILKKDANSSQNKKVLSVLNNIQIMNVYALIEQSCSFYDECKKQMEKIV